MKSQSLILIICLLSGFSLLAQKEWSMVCGNKERTANIETDNLTLPLVFEEKHFIYGENFVSKGDILYLGDGGTKITLTAFNKVEKIELWSFEFPGAVGSIGNVPAVDGDIVFIGGQNAMGLYAFDRYTGVEQWMRPIGPLYGRCPVPDGNGHVYISSLDSFYCLNTSDGSIVWSNNSGGLFTPTLYEDNVYFNAGSTLEAYNALTGEHVWSKQHTDGVRGQIIAKDDIIYDCQQDQVCAYSVDAFFQWCYTLPDGQIMADLTEGIATVTEAVLCFAIWSGTDGNSSLVGLDISNGEELWEQNFNSVGISSLASANGIVYVIGSNPSSLRGYDAATGLLVFEDVSVQYWGSPIISNDRLYAMGTGGISVFKTDPSSTDDDFEINNFICYPNPFSNDVSVAFDNEVQTPVIIRILNANGSYKIEKRYQLAEDVYEIPMDGLLPGIYIMEAIIEDKKVI